MAHCDCIDSSSSSSCRCGEEDRLQQRPLVLDAVRTWCLCNNTVVVVDRERRECGKDTVHLMSQFDFDTLMLILCLVELVTVLYVSTIAECFWIKIKINLDKLKKNHNCFTI